MIPLVNLKRQYLAIKQEVDEAITAVVRDCAFVKGPYCAAFEKEFAAYVGAKECVGCSSGTTAIELALRAYGICTGHEVIVPSHTFIATAEAVIAVGAKPVFADISKKTYTIDPAHVAQLITLQTKAIIPVHLYGQACDMDPLMDLARNNSLAIIEDCAQAHGTEYKGKRVPVSGTGCFSFYPGKNLGAYGDAGCVVTNDTALATRMREFLDHGRHAGKKYEHDSIGSNYRPDGIQGAVLSVKLKHLDAWTKRRREVAALYTSLLGKVSGITVPHEAPYGTPVYHLYVIRTSHRDAVLAAFKAKEIEGGIHYPIPLHLQPAYKKFGYRPDALPITEKIAPEIVSLPICADITDEEIRTVAQTVIKCVTAK